MLLGVRASIGDYLRNFGAAVELLQPVDAQAFDRRWLEMFARDVKAQHKTWVYRGYRWHGFSYGIQTCRHGLKALSEYQSQWRAPYIVFDEALSECLACESEQYPDLSPLGTDVYVSHTNLKWTMVFTHEQPWLGPFFAMRDDG